MSDKHTDAQGELREDFEAWCLAERNDLSSIIDEFGNKHYCSTFTGTAWRVWQAVKIRATEGQAQTSAAGWNYAMMGLPNEEVLEMWRAAGHSGTVPFSFASRIQESLQVKLAAQLADSTAPDTPVVLMDGVEQYNPAFDKASGKFYCEHGRLPAPIEIFAIAQLAAPTAQQSLTAGGAVPEGYRIKHSDFRHFSGATVSAQDAVVKDLPSMGYYKGCTDLVITPLFAAAPLPQVQSEAVDEPDMLWLHDDGEVFANGPDEFARDYANDALMEGESAEVKVDCAYRGHQRKMHILAARDGDATKVTWKWIDQQPVTPSGALADNDGGVA